MAKKLLITEKPSVAMEFQKVIAKDAKRYNGYLENDEWIITWCVGHLVTMSYPEVYDEKLKFWRMDTLPFIPEEWKYEIISNVKKQFEIIKSLMTRPDIEAIYNAGDSGREGEYIQRLVLMMVKPDPKVELKRVWIDSQTEDEIKRGVLEAKPSSNYDSLSDSAYLRAKEDYLIGINFSRMLSIIYGKTLAKNINEEKASISVGRVMTCVLGMVVEREREIKNFVKTPFYKVVSNFNEGFNAEWKVTDTSTNFESPLLYNETGFKKEEDAKAFIEKLNNKTFTITELKKTKQKENAPLLFNLAELQNECTKRFKIKPDETLEIAQALYEKKLITYPRTDARVLSSAVNKVITKNLNGIATKFKNEEVQGYIKEMSENKFSTNLEKTKYVNDSKITDHYAIIPTGQGYDNFDSLTELQKNVYLTIVKRFLSIFYPPAEFEKLNITVSAKIDDTHQEDFFASTRVCKRLGYLTILKPEKNNNQDVSNGEDSENNNNEDDNNNTNLQNLDLKKGMVLNVDTINIKQSETTPPTRYNSGSMILAMENAGKLIEDEELREQIKGAGIGTSATRAGIIQKLEKINYIQINNKTQIITPTIKGEYIYDIVKKQMPDLLNPKLTASWEKGLDMVYKKEIPADEFMSKLKTYIEGKFIRLYKS